MATFAPPAEIKLTRRGPASYDLAAGALDDLGVYLEGLQFWPEPPRSPHEHARYRSGRGALVVLYHSGAVVIQGSHREQTHAQLARFVAEGGRDAS